MAICQTGPFLVIHDIAKCNDSMFFVFLFLLATLSLTRLVFSGSASALAIGFGNIQWSGFYQSLLEDVMQVAGLQQLAILSTSGHPACVIAGRKIQADPRSLQLNKLCFWV